MRQEALGRRDSATPYDSHPPIGTRIEYARRLNEPALPDQSPATALFDDWDQLNAQLAIVYDRTWRAVLTGRL